MSAEILIIDDNPDIRNIIRDLINESGYKTRVAANYNQALKEIDKKLPDVAIIDVKLVQFKVFCRFALVSSALVLVNLISTGNDAPASETLYVLLYGLLVLPLIVGEATTLYPPPLN